MGFCEATRRPLGSLACACRPSHAPLGCTEVTSPTGFLDTSAPIEGVPVTSIEYFYPTKKWFGTASCLDQAAGLASWLWSWYQLPPAAKDETDAGTAPPAPAHTAADSCQRCDRSPSFCLGNGTSTICVVPPPIAALRHERGKAEERWRGGAGGLPFWCRHCWSGSDGTQDAEKTAAQAASGECRAVPIAPARLGALAGSLACPTINYYM